MQTVLQSIVVFSYDGENFTSAGSSKFSHRSTYGLANYMGKALITGCYAAAHEDSNCGKKTEIMDMSTLEWSNGVDYAFSE